MKNTQEKVRAEYMAVIDAAAKEHNADTLTIACIGLSNLALDLAWAMQWIDTLTDRLGKDALVTEFMADLEGRCKSSRSLEMAAKEAELI